MLNLNGTLYHTRPVHDTPGRRMDTWILFGYYRFEYPHSGYYRIGVSTLRIL